MKCYFVVEVKYYISGSFLGSIHMVHVVVRVKCRSEWNAVSVFLLSRL